MGLGVGRTGRPRSKTVDEGPPAKGRRGLGAVLGWYVMGLCTPGLPLVLLSVFQGAGHNLEKSSGGAGHPPPSGDVAWVPASTAADPGPPLASRGAAVPLTVASAHSGSWQPREAPAPGLTVHMVSGCSLGLIEAPGESHSHQSISHTCWPESEVHCLSLLPT